MKIKDGIKAGIGFAIGMSLACVALKFVSEKIEKLMNKMANDKEYMEKLKTDDPAGYETLQKYTKHD